MGRRPGGLSAVVAFSSFLAAGVISAQVCSSPGNLIPAEACGFDTAISWWETSLGTWSYQPGDGHDAAGSARGASAGTTSQSVALVSPCLPASASTSYAFGASMKWFSGADPEELQVMLVEYANATCSPPSVGPPVTVDPGASGWNLVEGFQTTGTGERSLRLVLQVSRGDASPFEVLVDDLFVIASPFGSGICSRSGSVIPPAECGFDAGISWWEPSYGTWAFEPADGRDAIGSAQADSAGTTSQSAVLVSPCLAMAASTTYTFGGAVKWVGGAAPQELQMMLAVYAGSDCEPPSFGPPVVVVPAATGWSQVAGSQTTREGDGSARVVLQVTRYDSAPFTVLVDDVFLTAGSLPVPVELARFSIR